MGHEAGHELYFDQNCIEKTIYHKPVELIKMMSKKYVPSASFCNPHGQSQHFATGWINNLL